MKVSVKLFAAARDAAGTGVVDVSLPQGADVAALRAALADQWPNLALLVERSLVAVNAEYAPRDAPLAPGDDVALIPPVSGG